MDYTLAHLMDFFRQKDPTASDAEINQMAQTFMPQQAPQAPVSQDGAPSMDLNIPDANDVKSSFDVPVSDNTVTQNGSPDSLPHAQTLPPMLPPAPAMPEPMATPASPEQAPASPSAALSQVPTKEPVTKQPAMDNIVGNPSNDNDARNKMLADQEAKKGTNKGISLLGGIADAVGDAAVGLGGKGASGTQAAIMKQQESNEKNTKADFELKLKNDPNSDISKSYRQMVTQIAPDLANNPNFVKMSAQAIGEKLPLIDTMMKARAQEDAKKLGMEQIKATKESTLGLREDQQQDKLENQATQRLASLRGDQSLARIETQRDGAISAYRTLDQAEKEGRALSKAEYYDLLGQIWKARTGGIPGPTTMQDLDSKTFHGDINKAATYFTGKPMGATTPEVLANLKNFVKQSGDLADEQHSAYMAPHLVKPAHLKPELWDPISKTARGESFSDSIKGKQTQPSSKDPMGIL